MKRADKRKYHYIYKTTRFDGKFYIGMHSTDDLEDGYQGSGTLLSRSIAKHGRDSHTTEILEFLESRELLRKREAQIIDEELLGNPKCMNLQLGGCGGSSKWHAENAAVFHRSGWEAMMKVRTSDSPAITAGREKAKETFEQRKASGEYDGSYTHWIGRKHTEETKSKMRKTKNVGEENHNFGKRNALMNNGLVNKRVPISEIDNFLANGWQRGMIVKKKPT